MSCAVLTSAPCPSENISAEAGLHAEFRADAIVEPDAARHFLDIGPTFRKIRNPLMKVILVARKRVSPHLISSAVRRSVNIIGAG